MLDKIIYSHIKKLIQAGLYAAIAVGFYSLLDQISVVTKAVSLWVTTYNSMPTLLQWGLVVVAGALTTVILKNVGAYHVDFNHETLEIRAQGGLSVVRTAVLMGLIVLGIIHLADVPQVMISPLMFKLTLISCGVYLGKWLVYPCYLYRYLKCFTQTTIPEQNIETPITSTDKDEYDHKYLAEHLMSHLLGLDGKTTFRRMALCGDFGSGKSSTLNMIEDLVDKQVNSNKEQWIFVHFDAWGRADETPNVQGVLLTTIIQQLTRYFETSSVQGVPNNYLETLKDAHQFTKLLVHLVSASPEPTAQLTSLNKLIKAHNYRVCVFIEDIDRNAEPIKVINALAPLLNSLRNNDRISFILSLGYSSKSSDIISRVIDYREDMPPIDFDRPLKDMVTVFHHNACSENIVLFNEPEESNWLFTENRAVIVNNNSQLALRGIYSLLRDSISTPRQFAAIKREVTSKWGNLKGELNFDDLLLLSTLKIIYPTVFDFISLHVNSLQQVKGKDNINKLDNLWNSQVEKVTFDSAQIKKLVQHLFPRWLYLDNETPPERPQAVAQHLVFNDGFKNYWNVYMRAGDIGDRSTKDQLIYQAMQVFDKEINENQDIPVL